MQVVSIVCPLEQRTKLENDSNHESYAARELHVCHSNRNLRAMVFWYHACLKIYRHKHERQLQFPIAVVHRDLLASHQFQRILLLVRCLLLDLTRQHSGLFIIENLTTFWMTLFFIFRLLSGLRSVFPFLLQYVFPPGLVLFENAFGSRSGTTIITSDSTTSLKKIFVRVGIAHGIGSAAIPATSASSALQS